MNEREIIKQVSVESKIYDLGLTQMVKRVFEEDMLSLEKDIHLSLDVVFNKCVYQEEAFYQYPVPKETKGPKPRTERERHKQMIYDVLGEQLDKITSALEQVGVRFGHVSVIGDDLDGDSVQIILYREPPLESSGRKKQTVAHVTSIMPDRPYIIEQASKVFAEMVLKQMREETKTIIVLQNLESVPYLLFAETDEGLVSVLQTEADQYKKLHVSWGKSE